MPDNGQLAFHQTGRQNTLNRHLQGIHCHATGIGPRGEITIIAVDIAKWGWLKNEQTQSHDLGASQKIMRSANSN